MLGHELVAERRVAKGLFDGGLAVVEVAAGREDVDVVTLLGGHLAQLDVGDAAVGIEDTDAYMLAAGEALKRRLARVAGGGHEDEVVVVEPALFAQLARCMLEEAGQALQGHVLEG